MKTLKKEIMCNINILEFHRFEIIDMKLETYLKCLKQFVG